jgi:hypothetical protein
VWASVSEVRREILAHPWEAIALALAVGAYFALDRTGVARRSIMTSIGAAALGTVREAIVRAPKGATDSTPASRFAVAR